VKISFAFKRAFSLIKAIPKIRSCSPRRIFTAKPTTKEEQTTFNCPVCDSPRMKVFYRLADVPASCNFLWASKEAATNCPRGNIKLAFCPVCSFITNVALEPTKNVYTELYDNSLFYSTRFQDFTKQLAAELVQRFDIHNKAIIEIGGGKVDFLSELCKLGNNHGQRLNPFYLQEETKYQRTNYSAVSIPKFQSDVYDRVEADFVFSYHELEHVNYPRKFLHNLRKMISRNPEVRVFFTVPNALTDLEGGCFEEIIYEHVSYFTPASLSFLFSRCGFNVLHVEETKGDFGSIFIDATIRTQAKSSLKSVSKPEISQIEDCVISFADKTNSIIEKNGRRIRQLLDQGKRVVMWGAGSRGVTLLNVFRDLCIEYAVDVNPRKQGKYVPGTGQEIIAPTSLSDYQPDYIVLANSTYEKEIREIVNNLEIETEFITI